MKEKKIQQISAENTWLSINYDKALKATLTNT